MYRYICESVSLYTYFGVRVGRICKTKYCTGMLHIYLFSYFGNDGPKIVLLQLLRIVLLPTEAFTCFTWLSIFQIASRLKGLLHHFAYGCICICSICSRAFGLLH